MRAQRSGMADWPLSYQMEELVGKRACPFKRGMAHVPVGSVSKRERQSPHCNSSPAAPLQQLLKSQQHEYEINNKVAWGLSLVPSHLVRQGVPGLRDLVFVQPDSVSLTEKDPNGA